MKYETAFNMNSLKPGDLLIVNTTPDVKPTLDFVFRNKESVILIMGGIHICIEGIWDRLDPHTKALLSAHSVSSEVSIKDHSSWVSLQEATTLPESWRTERHLFELKRILDYSRKLLEETKTIDFLVIDHFSPLQKLNPSHDVLAELENLARELNAVVICVHNSIGAGF